MRERDQALREKAEMEAELATAEAQPIELAQKKEQAVSLQAQN